jgi:hypothetical protein
MQGKGTTRCFTWRRAAALFALAPVLVTAGLAAPAAAAKTPTDDSTTTPATIAPADPDATTTPAGTEEPKSDGTGTTEAGSDQLSGEPGECNEKSCKHLTPIVDRGARGDDR